MKIRSVRKYSNYGTAALLPGELAESYSFLKGTSKLRTHVYEAPFPNKLESSHFPEHLGYLAHTRSFDAVEQFNPQKNKLEYIDPSQHLDQVERKRYKILLDSLNESIASGKDDSIFTIANRAVKNTPNEFRLDLTDTTKDESRYWDTLSQFNEILPTKVSDLGADALHKLYSREQLEPIRHVMEIQSDLFQRKFNVDSISTASTTDSVRNAWRAYDRAAVDPYVSGFQNAPKGTYGYVEDLAKEFSEQTPKMKNNWYRRVVREEARRAVEDGVYKLRFPTGPTATKVEGWIDLSIFDERTSKDVTDDAIAQRMQEVGFPGHQSLYRFYDKELPKFLKKEYGDLTKTTDPYGHSWWQVDLKDEHATHPIMVPSIAAGAIGAGAATGAYPGQQREE